jgi:protein-S-isoprenylcysteine O-methyltransferase Ste14
MPTTGDTLWAMWSSTMAAFGTVIAVGGGAAAIAFALFRIFGEKWLSAKFNERLEAYKHAQQ